MVTSAEAIGILMAFSHCDTAAGDVRLDAMARFRRARRRMTCGMSGWVVEPATARPDVRLTVQRLTRAAKAHVATAARHAACPHLKRAVQAA